MSGTALEGAACCARVRGWVPWMAAVLPPAFLLFMLVSYGVDVPYWDQWDFVPLLEKAYGGDLAISDLWAPHNEHRLLFPKAILLILAYATHWDISYELVANVLLACGVFGLFLMIALWMARESGTHFTAWFAPIVSLVVFSVSQWENWFFGWQLQVFLCVLSVVGGMYCLTHVRRPVFFMLAVVCAVVASYSFGAGMLIWPVGLCMLWLLSLEGRARLVIAIWLLLWCAAAWAYVQDGWMREGVPETVAGIRPLRHLAYVLKFLGAPVVNWDGGRGALLPWRGSVAGVMGAAGLIGWMLLMWKLGQSQCAPRPVFAVLMGLGLFSILGAIMTSVARSDDPLGSEQALSPRYITVANLFWVSLAIGLFVWPDAIAEERKRAASRCGIGVLLALSFLLGAASLHGAYVWTLRYPAYEAARQELISGQEGDAIRYLHPDPGRLRPRIEFLRKEGLSIFHCSR